MLTITTALCLCLGAAVYAEGTVTASGTCGANGDNLTWTLYDTGELVIEGMGEMANFFGDTAPWYKNCYSISYVTIHDGVTSIGGYAFYDSIKLETVSIPETVKTIGYHAFDNCTYLVNVTIPESVTSIGEYAFYGCNRLTSVTIPVGVTSIGTCTFYGCSRLTSVTISEGVTSISWDAFKGCRNLTSIHIASLEAWCAINLSSEFPTSYDLYLNNALVTDLIIPDSVTRICGSAFRGCRSLTSVTIPKGVTSINSSTFYGCRSLTRVTIPDSVTRIRGYAFYGCSSLTNVSIPEGVTSIGDYAFYGCSQLTSVTIPESLRIIGDWAFLSCTTLTDVYYGGSEVQWKTVSIGKYNYPLTNATIHYTEPMHTPDFVLPASLTAIESEAFAGGAFTYVLVPADVETIVSGSFANCPNLQYVEFAGSSTLISDGAFGGSTDFTIIAPAGSSAATWAIQHDVNFQPAA